ncbi:MAG: hypothetical protein ABJF10_00385 [Chthoniobacter sp.]|uniref:hypothetical protein n=1 Tax=Chthoniobacter sp. TaxID=2510640 RepID=UPI0032A7BF94
MSDHSHEPTPPAPETFDPKHAGGLPKILLTVGIIGIAGSLIGFFVPAWHQQFAFSWLFASFYFFTICIGGLFWTCLHHATDAEWSVVVRRQMENIAKLLPYFAIIFLPVLLFCMKDLWKWWDMQPGEDPLLDGKSGFLNHKFFYIRAVAYFFFLSWIATTLWKRSTAQDTDGAAKHTLIMRKFGVGGIPALALCITFAGVDWLMGLDYHWFSTMWGVYLFAGAAGSSMSLLVLIVTGLKKQGYLSVVNDEHYHIMGKFMLAFTIFWAYIGFDQYMLIWYANIPEETMYFRLRNTESWWYFSQALVVCRFFLPFPVLLFQYTKMTKKWNLINWVACWILFMQLIDIYVVVLPALHRTGFSPSIFDLTSLAAVGGILGWLFFRNIGKSFLFPTRDPRLLGSLKLTN